MSPIYAEPEADGTFAPLSLATGEHHKILLRTLKLENRYHDDDPIQEATFTVRFANGYEVSGRLDKKGCARVVGVPSGQAEVRDGSDNRPFEPVKQEENPDYRPEMSDAGLDALMAKYEKG